MLNSRILITGAGGFIGHHVTGVLAQRFASVVALTGPGDPSRDWPANVESREIDIREPLEHEGEIDCIVHLAGPPSVAASFDAAQHYINIHTCGTANLLQFARSKEVRRFVYISSAEVYGQPLHNPVSEDHRLLARSPYGAAKIGAEQLVKAFSCFGEMSAVILRPFSIYGPGQSMKGLLGTIHRQLREAEERNATEGHNVGEIVLADLRPVRDYCFVGDLAEAVASACTAEVNGFSVLNVAGGQGVSVGELAKSAASAFGRPETTIRQAKKSDRPSQANIMELVADRSLAKQTLGWVPQTSLIDGLQATFQCAQRAEEVS